MNGTENKTTFLRRQCEYVIVTMKRTKTKIKNFKNKRNVRAVDVMSR